MNKHTITVGARVKYSDYFLQPDRDRYLNAGNNRPRLQQEYNDKREERGTVTELIDNGYCLGYGIDWDKGYASRCMGSVVCDAKS